MLASLANCSFTLAIIRSVEATIEVRITSGSWPHGLLRAQFTAGTASIPGAQVILLPRFWWWSSASCWIWKKYQAFTFFFESVHCTCFVKWKWEFYTLQGAIRRGAIRSLEKTLNTNHRLAVETIGCAKKINCCATGLRVRGCVKALAQWAGPGYRSRPQPRWRPPRVWP
jgi:hypothetical protein